MPTVLIIDDETGFLQITQIILQRAGFQAVVASNGPDGIAAMAQHRPDIVILDDMMPGMTGGQVCQRLKADPDYQNIPIVMHSAGPKVRNPAYIQEIGADGVLVKPAIPSEIIDTINQYLGRATG